jgi:hypothetical protein
MDGWNSMIPLQKKYFITFKRKFITDKHMEINSKNHCEVKYMHSRTTT